MELIHQKNVEIYNNKEKIKREENELEEKIKKRKEEEKKKKENLRQLVNKERVKFFNDEKNLKQQKINENFKIEEEIRRNKQKKEIEKRLPYIINNNIISENKFLKNQRQKYIDKEIAEENEIYEMEDKIKIDLEKKLESAFEQRVPEAKRQWKITIDQENYNSDIANSKSRSFSDKEQNYFISPIEPKYIKGEINHFDYIKIKGFLQPNIFMYDLCEELDKKFKDLCLIEPSEEKLKFIAYFIEKIETQNDNEKKETIKRNLVSFFSFSC